MVGSPVLGISVGTSFVRAVLRVRRTIQWAGSADYTQPEELTEAIARLAGESGPRVRTTCVVLEREMVQLRTIEPAPPLKRGAMRQYVALEAQRLFRKNGSPLVTDAVVVAAGRALLAVAAEEPLLQAVLAGCAQAGLRVRSVCPATEVVAAAIAAPPEDGEIAITNGGTTELLSLGKEGVHRSRLVNSSFDRAVHWSPPLAELGDRALLFATAYAATIQLPRLELWPHATRRERSRDVRLRLARIALVGTMCWVFALAIYVGRLVATTHHATQYLDAIRSDLDSTLALRRQLDAGTSTLETVATARRSRSRTLMLLGDLTASLDDSTFLVGLSVATDGSVRFAGLTRSTPRVLAQLERTRELGGARLEGSVTREAVPGRGEMDRFSVVARLETRP